MRLHTPDPSNHTEPKPPQFVRVEKWQKVEPPRATRLRCKCGGDDKWKCWHGTTMHEVLGEGRSARGFSW